MDDSAGFLMEKLRAKGGTYKSFKEYSKSLRMTLLEKRYALEISEKNLLQQCLDLLQQNILVSTLPAIIERLEVISRHLGLKFLSDTSRSHWFISTDMFYVEVILEPNGHVKDVKINHNCTGEAHDDGQSCEELKTTLENRDFKDFTLQLDGLISIYNLNADQNVKHEAFKSLQYLEADILQLSDLQSSIITDAFNIIHKSNVGFVQKRRGGHPMKIVYFVSPYDLLDISKKTCKPLTLDLPDVDYSVSLCLESSSATKLQTQSLVKMIKSEKMDESSDLSQPTPIFEDISTCNTNLLPACFVMKLKKNMPICETLINQMKEITGIEVKTTEGPFPILSLIKREIHKKYGQCEDDSSIVTLPDQRHCYIMTNNYDLLAYIVQSIPFSHPAHVSKILPLLRQQALFNSFIASCIRPKAVEDTCDTLNQNFSEAMHCDSEYTNGFGLKLFGSEDFKSLSIFNESPPKSASSYMTMFEVIPLSLQQITVSFEHPVDETLITAELDISDVSNLRCNISMASEDSNTSVINAQECAARALQSSFSIPATMRALIRLWESQTESSDEEDLNESSTNNDVADLDENTENNIKSENGKENGECPSVEFGSGLTVKLEASDSCENSLDGFPSLSSRNGGEFSADGMFAVPNPSLRYQPFDAEMLPPTSFDSTLPFLDNTNEQPIFEPKGERADLMENRFFKGKSVNDLFAPKGQRLNDCEIVIDSSSDSEPSEAVGKETITETKDPSPGSNSSLEFSALTDLAADVPSEKPHSEFEMEHGMMEVNNLEDVQQFLKLTENKMSKNDESGSFASSIISELEGKTLMSPSVSITPVTWAPTSSSTTSATATSMQNLLNSMCLERRPGIDVSITPFTTASASPSLPASLTITPINVKESDERTKERKSTKLKNVDDKSRLDKKKKRKHDDSPMGPPEKIPAKADPLSRPVSVSIKPTESTVLRSPSPSSAQRKFTVSPTQQSSLSMMGKISPNNSGAGTNNTKCKSISSAPPSLASSPKMGVSSNVSPKHSITSSPKNVSTGSSGKPSMSALKSAVTSPSSSSKNSDLKIKSHKDPSRSEYKEKKNSSNSAGHQSPKLKSSGVKYSKLEAGGSMMSPQYDGPAAVGSNVKAIPTMKHSSKLMDVVDRLTSSKTEDGCNNGNGKSNSSVIKDVKNSSQVSEIKGNQSLAKVSNEYMIKHHNDGIRMTINRTRTAPNKTGSTKTSVAPGNDSPKSTSTKPSVGDGALCKKTVTTTKPTGSSTTVVKTSSSSSSGLSKHSSKSSGSSYKSKSNHSPKGIHPSDPNRKEKIRPPKTHSDKSIFTGTPKRASPALQGDLTEGDKPYKPPYQPTVLPKPLANYQIPKISDRNKMSGESESKRSETVSSDGERAMKDGVVKPESSSPLKIPFGNLEERGVLIETKNMNTYESSKSKLAIENSVETVTSASSQHQMTSSCSIASVPTSDSIKLNSAAIFHSRYEVIGRPAEFEYSACGE